MKKNRCGILGVTLIELLTVIAIIGILAAIAYPNYTDHVRKVRRADAQKDLMALTNYMERHFTANDTYLDENGNSIALPFTQSPRSGSNIYYRLSLNNANAGQFTYKLEAKPQDAQQDDICGTLSIDQAGIKNADKTNCWK